MKGKRIAPNMGTKIGLIEHIYYVIFCAGCWPVCGVLEAVRVGERAVRCGGVGELPPSRTPVRRAAPLMRGAPSGTVCRDRFP